MHLRDINFIVICVVIYMWSNTLVTHKCNHTDHDQISDIGIDYDLDEVGYKDDGVAYNPYDFGINSYAFPRPRHAYVTCQCGESKVLLNKSLNVDEAEKIYNKVVNSLVTNETVKLYPYVLSTKNCKTCEVGFFKCKDKPKKCIRRLCQFDNFSEDDNKTVVNVPKRKRPRNFNTYEKRSVQMFTKTIHIPIGGIQNHIRQKREVDPCLLPVSLLTSEYNCSLTPGSITCTQRCAFGYTFENGISQDIHCKFKDNKWTPHGFKECQPFVDCNIRMISGGYSSCTAPSLNKAPQCKIACSSFIYDAAKMEYAYKNAPKKSYTCDIDGKWSPPLPYCVAGSTGLVLAKTPKVKFHQESKKTDKYKPYNDYNIYNGYKPFEDYDVYKPYDDYNIYNAYDDTFYDI